MPAGDAEPYVFKDFPHSSHRVLLALAGRGPGRALDVGAGPGYLGRALAAAGYTVVGIDLVPIGEEVAARSYAAHHAADLAALSTVPEGPYDLIVAGDVLEHLPEPGRTLAMLAAGLAADGRLLVSVPNVAFVAARLGLLAGRFEYARRGIMDEGHLRFFTRRSLLRMVRATGLAAVRRIGVPPPLPLVAEGFGRWPGRAAYELAAAAARAWPTLFAYQLVVEARR